jgi:hypothetical protein
MISTHDLTLLPNPDQLRRLLQATAMLDAILEEEWENRYYSFDASWSESQQMGSMRNGAGDDFFAVFEASGCFLRGYGHASAMSPWRADSPPKFWPGVLDSVPAQFASCLKEPAFRMQDTTFCIWWLAGDARWSVGAIDFPCETDPDGSQWMLSELDCNPQTYQAYAREYFELDVPLEAIARVYAHEPLSQALLDEFASARALEEVVADAREIAYPFKI